MQTPVRIHRLREPSWPLPRYQTEGAAGMDLLADLGGEGGSAMLAPLERRLIPTGLSVEIPAGFEAQVRPRSGLALKHGVTCLNSPGTIDSDYRGEVGVLLINLSSQAFTLKHGDRIAQLVVAPVSRVEWVETQALTQTERGAGGFGSTGTNASLRPKGQLE